MNISEFLYAGRIFRYRGGNWTHRIPPNGEWCTCLGFIVRPRHAECRLLYLDYQGKVQSHLLSYGSIAHNEPEDHFEVIEAR